MKLEEIGFYTLNDYRAKNISSTSPMWRCEMILTYVCNFKCPYCRGIVSDYKQHMSTEKSIAYTNLWAKEGLKNIRYSGGEPTLHKGIVEIVSNAKKQGIERIAISTNGSADMDLYYKLVEAGVNDFSISLDACCASFADKMAGKADVFDKVVNSIKELSKITYVTVGVVLTEENVEELLNIVQFAHDLGVSDIRIISAAQYNRVLEGVEKISEDILNAHPILKYRVNNIKNGRNVRGINENDCHQCYLQYDDDVIVGDYHFPCIIYFREGGNPVGKVNENMREDKIKWMKQHDSYNDPICRKNCLDVCCDFNNKCREYQK